MSPGNLKATLGDLPRLRGPGWGGKRCEAIDAAVAEFVAQWPAAFAHSNDAWGDPDPHLFTSGTVQEFIAHELKVIVSRDSIRRRLAGTFVVHKFKPPGAQGLHWYKCPTCVKVEAARIAMKLANDRRLGRAV